MLPTIVRDGALPGSAWVLDWRDGSAGLWAGARVESGEGFIAEGAWAGEFSAQGMIDSPFRAGSGLVIQDQRLLLLPPSHALEGVYAFVASGSPRVVLSNSLHLVIARAPEAAPSGELEAVRQRARTLMRGVNAYERVLYSTHEGAMFRFAWDAVEIDPIQRSVRQPTRIAALAAPFETFEGYHALLSATVGAIVENARDARRSAPYAKLISSCSAGYDSTAAAVLARENGCREVVTLSEARGGVTDSGEEVAAALGMTCHVYQRFGSAHEARPPGRDFYIAAADVPADPYVEFLGSVNSSEDMIFSVFEERIAGAVFLTGFHGDKVWDIGVPSGPEVLRGDHSGSGLDEFRKRAGFVHLPVPFIAARCYEGIRRAVQAPDMAPFSTRNRYDRPLPRRLVEEAGVPRRLFGQAKMAGSLQLQTWLPETKQLRDDAFARLVEGYREALAAAA